MSGPPSTKIQSELACDSPHPPLSPRGGEGKGEGAQGLLARSSCYRLLACLFTHPKHGLAQAVLSDLPCGAIHNAAIGRTLRSLLDAAEHTSEEEWAVQFESALGHTAHAKAPAYELEYGEEHSRREPQELADIAAFYRAFGLKLSDGAHERADHVSIECEFMYFLCEKELYALEHAQEEHVSVVREASKRFLSSHLARWMPSFCLRLSKQFDGGLMKRLAEFALEFILQDSEALGVQAGPAHFPIRRIQEREETGCVSCVFGSEAQERPGDDYGNSSD